MQKAGLFFYSLFVGIAEMFSRAYVFMKLWQWFVVKGLNVPEISLTIAMGFMVIRALYMYKSTAEPDMTERSFSWYTEHLFRQAFVQAGFLGIAYVITLFIK